MGRGRKKPSDATPGIPPVTPDPVPASPKTKPRHGPKRRGKKVVDPVPTTPPAIHSHPNEDLLVEVIRKIGQLCDLLSRSPALLPAAAPPPFAGPPSIEPPTVQPAAPNDPTGLGAAVTLGAFMATVNDLDEDEQGQVIDAAQAMLEQVYVHLPLKRAMHAIDPIQRLKLLRQGYRALSPRGFHDEMIGIFHSLRDLHTNYILPVSYQGKTAFLPFFVEEYYSGNPPAPHYAVTRLLPGFTHPLFAPGVEVTHWNGVPIARAIEVNADREAGSNLDARLARGLEGLTIRPMGLTAPPDEEWVIVRYLANGSSQELRFEWKVFTPPSSPTGVSSTSADLETARALGVDAQTEAIRRAKKALFDPIAVGQEVAMAVAAAQAGVSVAAEAALGTSSPLGPADAHIGAGLPGRPEGMDFKTEEVRRSRKALFYPEAVGLEQRMASAVATANSLGGRESAGGPARAAQANASLMPDVFFFKTVNGPTGPLGYIRITNFMVNDPNAFVAEFTRIARLLPQTGLIIDVRGNGGGNILAGERLLQVLTPHPIDPARFHFIGTATTQKLTKAPFPDFQLERWAESIGLAIETGETYSQGWPLDPVEDYNRIGQQYQGPVVLIIDALCYSTTDIFAAGLQDHKIGKILGTQHHTGAGGANVWDLGLLNHLLKDDFHLLPKGASFRVAIRRTTRVKDRAGVPLEDLGVVPDTIHLMTRNDILNGNPDLIAAAGQLFIGVPVRVLSGTIDRSQPGVVRIQVKATAVARVDAFSTVGRPLATGDVVKGAATLTLNPQPVGPGRVQLRGFDNSNDLIVVGWVDL